MLDGSKTFLFPKEVEGSASTIRGIYNYLGGLHILSYKGKYFWTIEDCCKKKWKEIPESLYKELEKMKW